MYPTQIADSPPASRLTYRIALYASMLLWMAPLIAIFLTAGRPQADLLAGNYWGWPSKIAFVDNFREVFATSPMMLSATLVLRSSSSASSTLRRALSMTHDAHSVWLRPGSVRPEKCCDGVAVIRRPPTSVVSNQSSSWTHAGATPQRRFSTSSRPARRSTSRSGPSSRAGPVASWPRRWPAIRVLFVSGYNDDTVLRHGVERGAVELLQKPYTAEELASRIQALAAMV